MAAIGNAGPGARGGLRPPLTTINTMIDKRDQLSLSEGLAVGVLGAHRNTQRSGTHESRNFRRSTPMPRGITRK